MGRPAGHSDATYAKSKFLASLAGAVRGSSKVTPEAPAAEAVFFPPPGLEHDVNGFGSARSPVKIQMGSLSCHCIHEEMPIVDRAPETMLPMKAHHLPVASTSHETAFRPPRLQNAAYPRSNTCGMSAMQLPKKTRSSLAVQRGPRGHEMNAKPDHPKSVTTSRQSCSVPPALLARLNTERSEVSLYDVLPCLGAVARQETGSDLLRERLLEASQEVRAMVCGAALPEIVELSMHQFGHAFILVLMDVASVEQKKVIAEKLSSHVMQLTLDSYGCYVMQKALQVLSRDSREQFIAGLKEGTVECIKSRHGNHVMQVCIEELPTSSVSFIREAVEFWGADAASAHICACRVVMRLLEHMPRSELHVLLQQIYQFAAKLSQDRFGNYVLQHILEHGSVVEKRAIMAEILKGDVLELARQKYAHNVIKKCIGVSFSSECGPLLEAERQEFSDVLLTKDGEASPVVALANDRFGSVVVQCLMDHLQDFPLEAVPAL